MHQRSVYDEQHYIDRGWGGAAVGEPIDCTNFERLVITVDWQTAGGLGIARVSVIGTNIDQHKNRESGPSMRPWAASSGCVIGDFDVQLQNVSGGQLVAAWRDLPKWAVVRVDCLNGLTGDGSVLRVAVLGR